MKRGTRKGKKPVAPKGKSRITIADLPLPSASEASVDAVRGGLAGDGLSGGSFGDGGAAAHQCFVPGQGIMRD